MEPAYFQIKRDDVPGHPEPHRGGVMVPVSDAFGLIICDGPDARDGDAAQILGLVDDVVAIEETPSSEGSPSQRQALADIGVAARVLVRYDATRPQQQKRA